jgi:short-subunit dehydrogenase
MLYCAAYWESGKASDLSRAAFEPAFNVNLLGAVSAIEAVLPYMRQRKSGHIALVSSIAGYRGLPRAEAYGASKAALTYLGEAMRLTLKQEGIKIQIISPGFVATPLTAQNDFPMPFMIPAEDAARRVVKGLQSNRFEITFPKRFTYVLKLLRCLPYWLYFPLVRRATLKHRR